VTSTLLATQWEAQLGRLARRVDDAARFAWAFSATRSREQMLTAALELAVRMVRAEVGVMLGMHGGRLVVEANLGIELDVARELQLDGQSVVERVLESGEPLLAPLKWDRVGERRSLHVRSVLAVPVRSESGARGVMLLAHGRENEPFSEDDRATAALLASMAAVSVGNLEWMQRTVDTQCREHQLGTARLVQRTLLPDAGTGPPWLHWESYYRPATAIGGDYFDLVHLPDDSVAVAVGDVCDHGVPAALLMTSVRALLRALCLQGLEPERVLEGINVALCRDPSRPRDLVVSLFLAKLDVRTRTLQYANAGQVSPLLWDDTRQNPVPLASHAGALGSSVLSTFEQSQLPLGPGFRFLLYSDGLIETASPHGELFGLPRMATAVSEQMGQPGADFILGLRKRLEAFSGLADARDDVAMLWLGERRQES